MAVIPAGYKQTEVGVIPEDWDTPLLDSIARRGSGHTPDKKHSEYWNGSIKWISLKDSDALDNLYIEETAATITEEGIANSSAVLHPAGTVVLSRDAGVGKSAITKTEMAVSQHFMAWQCGPSLDNVFLYYWLQASKPEFERIAMGNTIKTIGLPFFRSLRTPHPPLPEQRAIAAALSDVDALLVKLDQLIAKKRDLKQAAMQQLLTGQTRLPGFSGAWEVKRLGDVLRFQVGFPFSSDFFNQEGDGLRLVKNRDLKADDQIFFFSGKFDDSFVVKDGNVLIGMDGDFLPCLWSKGNALLNQRVGRIVPSSRVSALFSYYMLTEPLKSIEYATSATTVKHLSHGDVEGIEWALPGIDEQISIATVLSDMDAELAALEVRRDKTRALKQGMMQELLTGRIRLA